jgi:4'-phosphopantetheinyl transferase
MMTEVYWLTQTEADVPANNDWLSPNELVSVSNMRFDKRRTDWRLGRWTAKRALAPCLEMRCSTNFSLSLTSHQSASNRRQTKVCRTFPRSPSHPLMMIEIRNAPSGAPEAFFDGSPLPLTISISHRAGRALCAVASCGVALGCDLEAVESRSANFAADYFTLDEQTLIERTLEADRPLLSTLIWSAKESALKALGEGLRLDTRSVVVSLSPSHPVAGWRRLSVDYADASQTFHGWWRCDEVGAGSTQPHVLTIVAAPPPELPIALRLT